MRRGPQSPVPTFITDPDTRPAPPVAPDTLDDWAPADGVRGSSRAQASASRGVHALLWTLLSGAVLLGLVGLLNVGARRGTAAAAPTAPAPAVDMPPGGCAELLVTAWLAGDAGVLGSLIATDLPPRLPAGRRAATHTYTVSTQPVPGTATGWVYVIGAEVDNLDKQGRHTAAGVQFFTTTLTRATAGGACGGWVAPALPSQVAGLGAAGGQDSAYDRSLPVGGHPIADTLNPFFSALLAGGGEVERYLAPGVQLNAVSPAPYSRVRLERLAGDSTAADAGQALPVDGTQVRLLATVAARVGEEPGEWRLTYPLSMTVRGGRWEITGLDPAPAPAANASRTPSTTRPARTPSTPAPSAR